jgi:TetR/AcrR family transcriptional regulator
MAKNMIQHSEEKTAYSNGEKAILDAAETLFAEKGFDAVSMSAIASLANTSKPNIYHHFKNKKALYLAIFKKAVSRTTTLLDAIEDAPGTFVQHLVDFSSGHLDNILGQYETTQLIMRETLTSGSERGREIAQQLFRDVISRLVSMIEKGQHENEFRKDFDPILAAFMIIAANSFFFQARPVMRHIPEAGFADDAGSFSRDFMDILFNGMLNEKGQKP